MTRLLFVSMPFGQKTGTLGPLGQRTVAFDTVWTDILRPAAPEGWRAIRIDEITQPGALPEQLEASLKNADVALFDLSFANPNVYFELGMRQSQGRPTVLVACQGTTPAFNIHHQRVFFYEHEDKSKWQEFQSRIREAILSAARQSPEQPDSPSGPTDVSSASKTERMPGWSAGAEVRMHQQIARAENAEQLIGIWYDWSSANTLAVDPLLQLGKRFFTLGRLDLAVDVLARAHGSAPDQYEVARTYGWYLSKAGDLAKAETLLRIAIGLNDHDVEALGMLGGVVKRISEQLTGSEHVNRLRDARRHYQAAEAIDANSVYVLINLGALSLVADGDEEYAAVQYTRVKEIVAERLARRVDDAWDYLATAEAHIALKDVSSALRFFRRAIDVGATYPMLRSAAEQLEFFVQHGVRTSECRESLQRVLYPSMGERAPTSTSAPRAVRLATTSEELPAVVHISDLHFGQRRPKAAKSIAMHRFGHGLHNAPLSDYVVAEIRTLLAEGRSSRSIVLVASGDIANEAHSDDYADALKFFVEVCDKTGLGRDQVVICPGNHDVNWKLIEHHTSERFDEYLKFLRRFYGDDPKNSLLRHLYPYLTWNYDVDSARPKPEDLVGVHHFPELNLVVTSINSCLHEDDHRHYGVVGDAQLKRIRERLAPVDPSLVRVAVLHHHVLPMDTSIWVEQRGDSDEIGLDASIVRDYGIVELQLAAMGFDIVLHGHKHKPALRTTSLRTYEHRDEMKSLLYVSGAGSAGVSEMELFGTGNHLSVLRMRAFGRAEGKPFLDLQWKEITNPHSGEWKEIGSWKLDG